MLVLDGVLVLAPSTLPPLESIKLRGHFTHKLRDRDHYTSSTFVGGKGGPGPSVLHTTLEARLEGSTKYVNARCM